MHLNRKSNSLLAAALISLFCNTFSLKYELHDLTKLTGENLCYATSINDKGQIGGILIANRMWFICENNKITKVPIYLNSSTLCSGCPLYINNSGTLANEFTNDLGQKVTVDQGKLYFNGTLIDSDSEWIKPENGYCIRINNNQQIVGAIKNQNGKIQTKYVNLKSGTQKILPLKYSCYAKSINDSGDVVGTFQKDSIPHSFLWHPETDNWQIIKDFSAATINNNKIIVGHTVIPGRRQKAAFWEKGIVSILDDLLNIVRDMDTEIESIEALSDINNKNEMVGWGVSGASGPVTRQHAVLIKSK